LVIYGLSHKTAAVDRRELFAVATDDAPALLQRLCERPVIAEAALLSTCNRVEAYVIVDGELDQAIECLQEVLLDEREMNRSEMGDSLYLLSGTDAMHHLLRVASSLDSMVMGEPQILGQVKEAVQAGRDAGSVGPLLGRYFDGAFSAAKAVRTQTEIGRSVVSVGSVAADLASRIFDDLASCSVLLVGAGKMAEATARSLASAGIERVFVTNRSPESALRLAQRYDWRARGFSELEDLLVEVDVVITSTGARRPIIDLAMARRVVPIRKYRPLFIVDIAVPRNVESSVGELDTVYVYNVDDLESVSETNIESRREAAQQAEELLRERVTKLDDWSKSLEIQPTLAAIRHRADLIARTEVERTLERSLPDLDEDGKRAIEKMASALVAKLLHPTMDILRRSNGSDPTHLVDLARQLHGIDEESLSSAPLAGEEKSP